MVLATIAGTEDQEKVVVGIEQLLHMDVDNKASETDLAELGYFLILNRFHLPFPFGNF